MPKANETRPGVWQAKGIDPVTGERKSFYGATPEEASYKAWRSKQRVIEDETLYSFYAGTYLPTIATRSVAWRDQIGWAMDGYVLPKLGKMPIADIKRKELQAFFNQLQRDPRLGLSSIHRIKIVLSGVLNLAVGDEVMGANFAKYVRLPAAPDPDKRSLTFAECKTLIDGAHDLARPYVLLGLCGLRPGERLGVTRSHMKDCIEVRQQVLQPKGGCIVTTTLKTPQSRRDVPIPASLRSAILNAGQVSGVWVCSNSKGGYLTPNNADRELRIALKASGFADGYITPHELRHTFISLLENELEIPPAVVCALAGKRDDRHAADYSHTHRTQLEKAMERYWTEINTVRAVKHLRQA